MDKEYFDLLAKNPEDVIRVNNVLTEAAWFYCSDEPELFWFLQYNARKFSAFFKKNFNWELRIGDKCARLIKDEIYNPALNSGIVQFRLRGRDEYIAFLLLIEFYEKLLTEQSMAANDKENPTFVFGDYLEYIARRMQQLFPERQDLDMESVKKKTLRNLMEKLITYRFLREIPCDTGENVSSDKIIYEALPACYQYNSAALEKNITEVRNAD